MSKKIFTVLFLITLLAALLCISVFAETYSGNCGINGSDTVKWEFDTETGTLTVTGTAAMDTYLQADAPWVSYSDAITTVDIKDGVLRIGCKAFAGCAALTSVSIPASVTGIGGAAFEDCMLLKNITIAEGVAEIDGYAFSGCMSLEAVTVPGSVRSIGEGAFDSCIALKSVTIAPGVANIGKSAFRYCSALQSIIIPEGVTGIEDEAFIHCSCLESVSLPASLQSVGEGLFSGCGGLKSVSLPDGVVSIPRETFSGCGGLTAVTIPASVTCIGEAAFCGCPGLNVYYGGTEAQWSQIEIAATGNDELFGAPIHYTGSGAPALTSVSVNTLPSKTECFAGDTPDYTGLTLTAVYDDETTQTIEGGFECAVDTSVPGLKTVTVTYEGKTASFEITVKAVEPVSIAVNTLPAKVKYFLYDEPDHSGLTVTVTYNNGAEETLSEGFVCTGPDTQSGGMKAVSVTYGGCETTFDVKVSGSETDMIELASLPVKIFYLEGKDELDLTGAFIWLVPREGVPTKFPVTEDMVSGFDNTVPGAQTVTVTYLGDTATFKVNVMARSLSRVGVTAMPAKTRYLEGVEEFDPTGGVITLYYDNDTSEETAMTNEMISGFDNGTAGVITLTATYQGKTATFNVTIVARSAMSITITSLPDKLTYVQGESFDPAGGALHAVYDNGTEADIEMTAEMIVGFDSTQTGDRTVTVKVNDATATFDVTVTARTLKSISVKTPPTKTEYRQGDSLDLAGGVLTLVYDNDIEEDIPLTDAEGVTGFSTDTLGTRTLTIYYGGKSTYLMIKVVVSFEWDCEVTKTAVTVKTIPEGVTVFAQFMDENGKITGIKKLTANAAMDIPAGSTDIRLFALDADNVPVAAKAEYSRPSGGGGLVEEGGGSWSPVF
ncbi:MAG: bacterial Ig-like domain-containing protein [Clostridia bacterium]|nr:bacterial Ig-like domain-containing protein [Clostridia bacterium]